MLILVTLALVAFGLVMVYSATSASATVGGSDPSYYLKRQGIYAALGIVLMIVAQRWDYRRLRRSSPVLVLASLGLLAAVLVVGPAINGARRWISFGPAVFQPSELAKLALAIWAAGYLARKPAPRDLRELWRPVGALAALFCVLLMLEPDMGTSIALLVMLDRHARRRRHTGTRARRSVDDRVRARAPLRSGSSRIAAHASSPSSTRGTTRRAPASSSFRR